MWKLLYNLGLFLAAPIIVGVLVAKPRCRRGFLQRMGFEDGLSGLFGLSRRPDRPDRPNRQDGPDRPSGADRPVIWVHAVSLGEAVAAVPLVKALHERHPDYRYIVTTVTETGREAVEQRLEGVAEHRYAPMDFSWAVTSMVDRLRPALYLFVETELWPNLLWTLRDRRVPTILVNGRLSSRSFRRQDITGIRSLYRSVLRSITLCLMQSDRDRQRIVALGADPEAVHTTGNIKFDQPLPVIEGETSLRRSFGLQEGERLILAGSTHSGEEELLVSAYGRIVNAHPSAVLMLAPRHIERVDQVEAMIRDAGFAVQRKSRIGERGTGPRVIILDTRGELARAYREAVVAFVGGTLVPVGGHNLLEPAVWGRPVLFGPYTDHCAETAALLNEAGGGRRVMGVEDMVRCCTEWLSDQDVCEAVGQAAKRVVLDNQGALKRSLELIESCLSSSPAHSLSLVAREA
jgi:3-deoxy-D-manno-octulosonic-acid transferase